tara:strand:- start:487 stop:660 length:174 start_codon:yes stop_codon:yes gene_type:complete
MEERESLEHSELCILSNALNEILNGPDAIEIEEFHTRIGASFQEAEILQEKLRKLLE